MKRYFETGTFMGAYYVEEKYERDSSVRKRYWFSFLEDDVVSYEGGMSYVSKRRVLSYRNPPNRIVNEVAKDGLEVR